MVTVGIADAHFLVREGMKRLLAQRPDIRVVGEARNSAEMRTMLRTQRPQVLIYDYDQGLSISMEDLLTVSQCSPTTRVLIITAETAVQRMRRVMDYGVCSFLLKECEGEEVTDAVYATARGENFFCNRVVDVLMQRSSSGTDAQKCLPTVLSRRELEIVERICHGQTANEIAMGLFLSVHTVNTHRKNIFRKVGVRSNAELVYHAISTSMV